MRCEPIILHDQLTVTFVMNNRHMRFCGTCSRANSKYEAWEIHGSFIGIEDKSQHKIDMHTYEGNLEVNFFGSRIVSHFENYSATDRVMGGALRELRTM